MKDKYYLVTVEETLSRTIKVKAESLDDAELKAEEGYYKEKIILDAEDVSSRNFTAREVTDEDLDLYYEMESEE